jgi:hypothetical protein
VINENSGMLPQRVTANSTALLPEKGVIILEGAAGLTGLTMRAPTLADIGREVEIYNIAAQTAGLVVTGMAFATADTYTIPVAGATVVGPSLVLKAINTTPQNTTPTPKWVVRSMNGVVTVV